MANGDKWTISNKSGSPAVGNDLNGLLIKETNNHYDLYAMIGRINKNQLPFTFQNVTIDGDTWDITVTALSATGGGGNWNTPSNFASKDKDSDVTQSGEFTAQSGGIFPDGEKAASSAKAS